MPSRCRLGNHRTGAPATTEATTIFCRAVFERPASARAERLGVNIPFSAQQSAAVTGDGTVWTGVGSEYRFVQLLRTGDTARIVEFGAEAAELSAHERAEALAEAEKARGSGYEADEGKLPRHHPAFSTLLTAANGEVWVRRVAEDRADSAVYDIFSSEGYYRGTLPSPFSEFPVPYVSQALVAGVVRDSLGEESVEVWRVERQRLAGRTGPHR